MQQEIKVLDQYVLVKQTMIPKKSTIILKTAKQDADKFDFKFEILQIGSECKREIKVGDTPIFAENVRFQGVKVLEKTETKMVTLLIVHEGDIIAIDNSLKPDSEEVGGVLKLN